jgi:hypothetical protein
MDAPQMNDVTTLHRYRMPVTVSGVHRHARTVSRRNRAGAVEITQIDLGWYVHIELDDETLMFACGTDRPPFREGESISLVLERS